LHVASVVCAIVVVIADHRSENATSGSVASVDSAIIEVIAFDWGKCAAGRRVAAIIGANVIVIASGIDIVTGSSVGITDRSPAFSLYVVSAVDSLALVAGNVRVDASRSSKASGVQARIRIGTVDVHELATNSRVARVRSAVAIVIAGHTNQITRISALTNVSVASIWRVSASNGSVNASAAQHIARSSFARTSWLASAA